MNIPFEPRYEDRILLTGGGRFLDDGRGEGEAHGVFVRSPHAFAEIRSIDTRAAHARPGVLAVLTAKELDAAGVGSINVVTPVPGVAAMIAPPRPSLARDIVRHVGDAVDRKST